MNEHVDELDNLPAMREALLVRLYLLGVYLMLRPTADLPRPDVDLARKYFADENPAAIRETTLKLLAELESRGIQPYHQ